MAEEVFNNKAPAKSFNGAPQQNDFSDYKPLEVNLGVYFTPKTMSDKTSVSLNYMRDYVKMNFTMKTDSGAKDQVFKKFTLTQSFLIVNAMKAIIADRMVIAKKFFEAGATGVPEYSELPEDIFEFHSSYYDSKEKRYVDTGKITLSTVSIDGVNRMCIRGYSETGMLVIRVVFFNDRDGEAFHRTTSGTTIDSADLDFFRFANEIDNCLKNTFMYACADKIYQAVHAKSQWNGNGNKGNFEKKLPFFNKNNNNNNWKQRQVSVNDSNSGESGADLFDQDVDF